VHIENGITNASLASVPERRICVLLIRGWWVLGSVTKDCHWCRFCITGPRSGPAIPA